MILTIDGLGVNGKSTLSKMLADHFKYKNFNTGAIYRCIALKIINEKLDINDISNTLEQLKDIDINFEKQEGIAFILIYYTHREEYYYLSFKKLKKFWTRAQNGDRKSFRYEELDPDYFLPRINGVLVPYLNILQKDLESRD